MPRELVKLERKQKNRLSPEDEALKKEKIAELEAVRREKAEKIRQLEEIEAALAEIEATEK